MKLKIALLATAATAGVCASVALADHGDKAPKQKCKVVHLRGTLAAASLSFTTKAGTAVSVSLPDGARAKGEACSDGTTLTLRHLEVEVKAPKATTTVATTQTTTTTTP